MVSFKVCAAKAKNILRVFYGHKFCSLRCIFSVSKVWEDRLSSQEKKDIETFWHDKINSPGSSSILEDGKLTCKPIFVLSMFPYPSGRLHMGHVRVYTLSDAVARFYRLQGQCVIHPMGWDGFGLPAENAARRSGTKADEWTYQNIKTMKEQLLQLDYNFDWHREFATCDPSYYKWTQQLFLLMYKKNLIYRRKATVFWDPVDRTVLADEQVDAEGRSWRSGAKVEKRCMTQWFIRATQFSKPLYQALSEHPSMNSKTWVEVKNVQKIWIGECNGYMFEFQLQHQNEVLQEVLQVWITKPEFLFGATFVTVGPDHFLNYLEEDQHKSDKQLLDVKAINPFTGKLIPIFVTDELEIAPATQSHIGIPCASEKDYVFAQKNNIEIINVIDSENDNALMNSGVYTGMSPKQAREAICQEAQKRSVGGYECSKHLRDWVISRQRYWGTPIPLIHCNFCNTVPVPEELLPVTLPQVTDFEGPDSPLAYVEEWCSVKCPKCGARAKREVDTMDTFVDSSWYFLRFLDFDNKQQMFDPLKVNQVMPVDVYIGGTEHTSQHLYYARVISHFLHSCGLLRHPEPFSNLVMVGMVKAQAYRVKNTNEYLQKHEVLFKGKEAQEKTTGRPVVIEWEKMSKSKLNGIDPEVVVKSDGVDSARLFVLANHAPRNPIKWKKREFKDMLKWQEFLWSLVGKFREAKAIQIETTPVSEDRKNLEHTLWQKKNSTIAATSDAFTKVRIDMAIDALNQLTRTLWNVPTKHVGIPVYEETLGILIIMLFPIVPHFASELWEGFSDAARFTNDKFNLSEPVYHQKWPSSDKNYHWELEVRVNDALKSTELLAAQSENPPDEKYIKEMVFKMDNIQHLMHSRNIKSAVCNALPGRKIEFCIYTSK